MTAGPPSGGRPPLTDAKPLVFTGIHSRVGIWSIVFSVVFLAVVFRPLSYSSLLQEKSDGGLAIGTIMLLIQIVPLVIGGLVGIVFILRHRQRLRVDANGFLICTGRRSRTLGWDQVRGNLAVAVIPQHARSPIGIKFNLKPLLLPVITVEGERIELPCLMGDPRYERRAHQRVERAMAAIAARDPGPGAGPVAPSRPDGLVLTEHRDDKGTAFILLGSACSCWGLAWQLWRSDYADALTRICAGVLVMLGLAALMFALHGSSFFGLRPDNVTVVNASGLRIRRGWRRRSLSWEQVRGHLEARAIPPNGKGGLRKGGPWSWGWPRRRPTRLPSRQLSTGLRSRSPRRRPTDPAERRCPLTRPPFRQFSTEFRLRSPPRRPSTGCRSHSPRRRPTHPPSRRLNTGRRRTTPGANPARTDGPHQRLRLGDHDLTGGDRSARAAPRLDPVGRAAAPRAATAPQ